MLKDKYDELFELTVQLIDEILPNIYGVDPSVMVHDYYLDYDADLNLYLVTIEFKNINGMERFKEALDDFKVEKIGGYYIDTLFDFNNKVGFIYYILDLVD